MIQYIQILFQAQFKKNLPEWFFFFLQGIRKIKANQLFIGLIIRNQNMLIHSKRFGHQTVIVKYLNPIGIRLVADKVQILQVV